MEHREPPRIASSERQVDAAADLAGGRFRLRRFDAIGNSRKFDYSRASLLVVAGLALAVALVYLTDRARRVAVAWLAHQSQYQLAFDRIELAPEPPPWYQGGRHAFLKGVRLAAGERENVAVLDESPDHLAIAFKKYAWVEEVVKVAYGPSRIRVDLRYRQPVAWVRLRDGNQKVVDRNGIILPAENVDVAVLGQVIEISGDISAGGLAAPSDPRSGVIWKSAGDGTGLGQVEERIVAASKLAAFLTQAAQANDAQQYPSLHVIRIVVTDFRARGLFVVNAEGAAILWGDAPGDEPTGKPTAEEKWVILRHWRETSPSRFLETGDYWAFSKRELRHVCPHMKDPHQPKERSSDRPG
jgi:hypothetical protein